MNAHMTKIASVRVLQSFMAAFPCDEVYFKHTMIYIHAEHGPTMVQGRYDIPTGP